MPYKDPIKRKECERRSRIKNRDKIATRMKRWRVENREHNTEVFRRWSKRFPEKVRIMRENYMTRLKKSAFELIPDECYYKNEFCKGRLEWDHKYGDGKEYRGSHKSGGTSQYLHVIREPDKWLRLCNFHNQRKSNTSQKIHESDILITADLIRSRQSMNRDVPIFDSVVCFP